MKRLVFAALAAILALPAIAAAGEENQTDIMVLAGAGTQENAFRADTGEIIRDVRGFDFRKWSGTLEVGVRIGSAIVSAGVGRQHTFAPDAGEDAGSFTGVLGAGVAAELGGGHLALLAYGETGVPEWRERRGVGMGVLVIRKRWVAGAAYWPATERVSVRFGVAF